jgi:hypothetical protein
MAANEIRHAGHGERDPTVLGRPDQALLDRGFTDVADTTGGHPHQLCHLARPRCIFTGGGEGRQIATFPLRCPIPPGRKEAFIEVAPPGLAGKLCVFCLERCLRCEIPDGLAVLLQKVRVAAAGGDEHFERVVGEITSVLTNGDPQRIGGGIFVEGTDCAVEELTFGVGAILGQDGR